MDPDDAKFFTYHLHEPKTPFDGEPPRLTWEVTPDVRRGTAKPFAVAGSVVMTGHELHDHDSRDNVDDVIHFTSVQWIVPDV